MVMAMLDAGGVSPVEGSSAIGHELGSLDSIPTDDLADRAVKLLDGISYYKLPAASWRFIWLDRDHHQQARSLVKFLRTLGVIGPREVIDLDQLKTSFASDRPRVVAAYESLGPVMVLRYESVLANPEGAAHNIAGFIDIDGFDITAAAGAVHQRTGECRSGMAFEMYGVST